MKKVHKLSLLALSLLIPFSQAFAQLDLGNEINKQGNSLIRTFSVIGIIGLIGIFIWQWDNLFSKNGDSKKAFVALIVYVVVVMFIVLIAQYIRGLSL